MPYRQVRERPAPARCCPQLQKRTPTQPHTGSQRLPLKLTTMSFASRLLFPPSETVTQNQLGREGCSQLITPDVLKNWDLNVRVSPDYPEFDLASRSNDKTSVAAGAGICVIPCVSRAVRGEKGEHRSEFLERTDF